MRDRLIELLDQNSGYVEEQKAEILADTILADGWMRPPLKMGDKVWIIDWCYEIREYEITHIRYNRDLNGQSFSYDAITDGKHGADIGFADEDIGKYVFLTREEAEQALRKDEEK